MKPPALYSTPFAAALCLPKSFPASKSLFFVLGIAATKSGECDFRNSIRATPRTRILGDAIETQHTVGWVVVASLLGSMHFRSNTRRRISLQIDLIAINGGTDEIF